MIKIILVYFCILGANAFAASNLPDNVISLEAKQAGTRDFIVHLLDGTNLKYDLPAFVTNKTKVNIQAKSMKWSEVFASTLDQAGLTYSFDENNVLKISKKK